MCLFKDLEMLQQQGFTSYFLALSVGEHQVAQSTPCPYVHATFGSLLLLFRLDERNSFCLVLMIQETCTYCCFDLVFWTVTVSFPPLGTTCLALFIYNAFFFIDYLFPPRVMVWYIFFSLTAQVCILWIATAFHLGRRQAQLSKLQAVST